MEVKVLEIRDTAIFIPVICIRPVAENPEQSYLLRRDGYEATQNERCVVVIKNQCYGVSYDPYDWNDITMRYAHHHIQDHWHSLKDGDVIDVEYIMGKTQQPKQSERITAPL